MEKIAVHEGKTEMVLKFVPIDKFTREFVEKYNAGDVYGVSIEGTTGKISAELIGGELMEDILI